MWTAAGEEDDLDEFDGFYIGGTKSHANNGNCFDGTSIPISNNGASDHEKPEGKKRNGFGTPKKKLIKEHRKFDRHISDKNPSDKSGEGPSRMITSSVDDFRVACMKGNIQVVEEFLKQGHSVDVKMISGWTALMYAVNNANLMLTKFLLEKGAKPESHADQFDVLMACCSSTQQDDHVLECVQQLIYAGANINSHDRYHVTPLMYAAREGHAKVIQTLVEKGAQIDQQDSRGWTSLSWSICKGHKLAAKKLLSLNANAYINQCDGQTPADMAFLDNLQDLLILMKDPRVDEDSVRTVPTGVITNNQPVNNRSSTPLTNSLTKQGELELFLCGLNLSSLVPLFHHHQIDFAAFLRLTEQDLLQMGVEQVGVRKKILDGIHTVHTKDWETSSLAVQYNKRLSYNQSLALMSNISTHLKYITSSIVYLNKQLSLHPAILDSQDGTGPKLLCNVSKDSLDNIDGLKKEVTVLNSHLQKTLSKNAYKPAGQISTRRQSGRKLWKRRVIVITAASAVIGTALYFKDSISNNLLDLAERLKYLW